MDSDVSYLVKILLLFFMIKTHAQNKSKITDKTKNTYRDHLVHLPLIENFHVDSPRSFLMHGHVHININIHLKRIMPF